MVVGSWDDDQPFFRMRRRMTKRAKEIATTNSNNVDSPVSQIVVSKSMEVNMPGSHVPTIGTWCGFPPIMLDLRYRVISGPRHRCFL